MSLILAEKFTSKHLEMREHIDELARSFHVYVEDDGFCYIITVRVSFTVHNYIGDVIFADKNLMFKE